MYTLDTSSDTEDTGDYFHGVVEGGDHTRC